MSHSSSLQYWSLQENPKFIVINTDIQGATMFSIYTLDGILKPSQLGQVTICIVVMRYFGTDDLLTVTDNNAILQR